LAQFTTYQLEAGLLSLPLSFAVKGERLLVELPPQAVTRYAMRVENLLSAYTSAPQFCFRFDDPALAAELRTLFRAPVRLARSSTRNTAGVERHEESPQQWLATLVQQWDESDDQTPITPSILQTAVRARATACQGDGESARRHASYYAETKTGAIYQGGDVPQLRAP
jgi:hypothetical protein